jgi:phage gp29-like protein
LVAFLAAEMSKATLGQTLTTEQGKVGTQALGKIHNDVRKDIRESDARALAATIRRDVLAPLTKYNFSPGTRVPLFRFLTEDAPDLVLLAKVCEIMAPIMPIPQSWARDQMGIPEPIEGEDILAGWSEDVDTSDLEEPETEEEETLPEAA